MEPLGLKPISRNILNNLAMQVIAGILGFCIYILIARFYGPEGNGTYALVLLLPTTLATFLNLGVGPSNAFYLGSRIASLDQILKANYRIFLLMSSIGTMLGLGIILWKGSSLFPGIDQMLLISGLCGFPVLLLNTYFASIFQGLQHFKVYNTILVLQPIVLLFLILFWWVLGNNQMLVLVVSHILSLLCAFLFLYRILCRLRATPETSTSQTKITRKLLSYGWKAHLSNILAFVNYKADVFLLNLFSGPAAVGIYVVSIALAEGLWIISRSVSTILFPLLSGLSSEEDKRRKITPLVARWTLLITLLAALLLGSVSQPLVSFFFGEDFQGAVLPILILLPGIVLASASRVLANDIAARGRPELNLYISLIVVFVNILANILLIPRFQLGGAAAATTIAYGLNLVIRLVVYGKISKVGWGACLFVTKRDFINLKM